jgi:hypoxanthine-DNA glycosylase
MATADRIQGLPPVIDPQVNVLIVGTFPGVCSSELRQYYADPRNQFWRILSLVHREDYNSIGYQQRVVRLLARRIGLWDVFESCVRQGSGDSSILGAKLNEFRVLKTLAPELERVVFNGSMAAEFSTEFKQLNYSTAVLPSSSSALARSPTAKATKWQELI